MKPVEGAGLADLGRPLFTVGQVAELAGVQPAFLRRLDTLELVSPARSDGRQRRYSQHDLARIEQIVGLVDEGLTLAGVRRVMVLEAELAQLRVELAGLRAATREEGI